MAKKGIFLLGVALCHMVCAHAHVAQEMLFSDLLMQHEKKTDGTASRVKIIEGPTQFYREVLENKKPVVVKVFSQGSGFFVHSMYHHVAESFQGKISFVSMDISQNEEIIRAIMMRLRLLQVNLPIFLLFKNRTLVLPLVTGVTSGDTLINIIKRQFFAQEEQSEQDASSSLAIKPGHIKSDIVLDKPKDAVKEREKEKTDESTWDKLKEIGEKIKKSLFGLQDLSKEVSAYRNSRRWKHRRNFACLP